MDTIYNLLKRAKEIKEKRQVDSITPEEVGKLHEDTLAYIASLEQSAEGLGVRKVYQTKNAMEVDTAPIGTNGKSLRYGQLVAIYDDIHADSPENGNIYVYQKPGWLLVGNIAGQKVDIVQSAGDSESAAMSQKAVTALLTEYDVSAANGGRAYTLADAIAAVPAELRKSGLTIKFVDSDSSKYAIWNGISPTWSTNVEDWKNIRAELRNRMGSLFGELLPLSFDSNGERIYLANGSGGDVGKWVSSQKKSVSLFNVEDYRGGGLAVTANDSGTLGYILFLTDKENLLVNESIHFAKNTSQINIVRTMNINIPNDARYMAVYNGAYGRTDARPKSLTVMKKGSLSSLEDNVSSTVAAVNSLGKSVADIITRDMDILPSLQSVEILLKINNAGKYENSAASTARIADVSDYTGKVLMVKPNASGLEMNIAFLTNNTANAGGKAPYSIGCGMVKSKEAVSVTVPFDAKYMYLFNGRYSRVDQYPSEILLTSEDVSLKKIADNIGFVKDYLFPKILYTTFFGDTYSRTFFDQKIYLDHLLGSYEEDSVPNVSFDTRGDSVSFNPRSANSEGYEKVGVRGFSKNSFSYLNRSADSENGIDSYPKVLLLGDSVGRGYCADFGGINRVPANNPACAIAIVQKMFMLQAMKRGVYGSKYRMQAIGHVRPYECVAEMDGKSNTSYAFNSAVSGATAGNFLFDESVVDTWNPFYDASKRWSNGELNTAGVKFSIEKYISNYRTHSDDGVELDDGDPTLGGKVVFSGENKIVGVTDSSSRILAKNHNAFVCRPTHVILQFGFNDIKTSGLNTFLKNMGLLIKAIREELPNAVIGVSSYDGAGTYFKEYYPNTIGLTKFASQTPHRYAYSALDGLQGLCNESDNIFFIPCYFVGRTAEGLLRKEVKDIFGNDVNVRIDTATFTTDTQILHPNNLVHSDWAKQMFSWMKWVLK